MTTLSLESANNISENLNNLFPKLEVEPIYSLGFQRWTSLKLNQKKALMILNGFDYNKCIETLSK